MKKGRRRYAPLLLAVICAALAGVLYSEADQPAAMMLAVNPPPHRLPDGAVTEAPFSLPPLRSYDEVVARPLFSPTRRPSSSAVAAGSGAAAFTLVGIVVSAHERHALVEHGQPPRLARIGEGQALDGWTLESIGTDRLVFRRGASTVEVKAKDAPAAPSAPRPAPSPATQTGRRAARP